MKTSSETDSESTFAPSDRNSSSEECLGSVLAETVHLVKQPTGVNAEYALMDEDGFVFPVWPDEVIEYGVLLEILIRQGGSRDSDLPLTDDHDCRDHVDEPVDRTGTEDATAHYYECAECDRGFTHWVALDAWVAGKP